MSVIVTIANKKGGVGKSLITINLGLMLAKKGYKTLLIDMDGQGTTTDFFTEGITKGIVDSMVGLEPIENTVMPIMENLDIIPATPQLNILDITLTGHDITIGQETVLKDTIESIKNSYDYILIDSGGVIDLSTKNALISSNYAIIPTICNGTSVSATDNILNLCDQIKRINPNFKVLGIVYNRYTDRSAIVDQYNQIYQDMAQNHKTKVFNSTIRNATIMENSYSTSEDWTNKKLPIKADFDNLIKEFINEQNSKGDK